MGGLNAALLDFIAIATLDIDHAREKVPEITNPVSILIGLHKARYELAIMPEKLRHESREWLLANGYTRLNQLEFPEDGSLPE